MATIVCIGDSITYGYPYGPEISWTEMLARASGHKVINRGINGNTTSDMLERMKRHVLDLNPDYVIIMGGHNDIVWRESIDRIIWNLEQMAIMAENQKIKVVWGLPVPFDEPEFERRLERVRQWIRNYARQKGQPVIDFYSAFFDHNGQLRTELLLDLAHPTPEGYKAMFECITLDIFREDEK